MLLSVLILFSLLFPLAAPGAVRNSQAATPATSQPNLSGASPLPLTGERRAAFESYVADALFRFGVPGAAVAVVQDGEVVYLNGFGVTQLGGTQPVTPDTMMMIGSITKSMTTMLAGSLIDDGLLTWDTRLVDLLPEFAVDDAALTQSLTVRNAFCNCSGLPGRQIEVYFENAEMTPAEAIGKLAGVAPTAPPGEKEQYNNLLIAAGGYAAGVAAEGFSSDLGLAYDTALRERILQPLGMTRSTFDPDEATASGDYALPHAVNLTGELQTLPLLTERILLPGRPAGALWSNAREMASFLQTELAGGIAPDGTRVVSRERQEEMWEPAVAFPRLPGMPPTLATAMAGYGLGWISGDYHGLRVISHAGGTNGFAAQIAFLPEANLGIVVLSNALTPAASYPYFPFAVQFRLFELLFEQPAEIDAEYAELSARAAARPKLGLGEVDAAAVAPYLGRYANTELGEVRISLRGKRLVLATSDLSTELRPSADTRDPTTFLLVDPPLSMFSEAGATLGFSGADPPELTLTIPPNPIGPEQEIVFKRVATTEG